MRAGPAPVHQVRRRAEARVCVRYVQSARPEITVLRKAALNGALGVDFRARERSKSFIITERFRMGLGITSHMRKAYRLDAAYFIS